MVQVRARDISRVNGRSFAQMTASRLLGSSALIPVAGLLALAPTQAFAQDATWDGEVSTDAANAANWDGNVAPDAGTRVFVNNGTLANQPRIGTATTYTQTNVSSGVLTIAAALTAPVNISGAGIVNLVSGGNVNGAINVSGGGTLELRGPLALGAPIMLGGSGAGGNGALRNVSGNNLLLGAITLSADARIGNDAGILQVNGATDNAGNLLTLSGAGPTAFVGAISGSGGFTVSGPGQVDLNGANTYTGTTTVNSGILLLNGGAGIVDTGRVVVNGGAFGVLNDETIGSLEGTGGFVSTSASSGITLLTVGGNNLSTTYAGDIRDNGGGRFALGKIGTGTLMLTNNNTYTGGTIISGGTLQIGNGGTTGTLGTGAVTNNAALVFNRSDDFIVANTISGSGTLTKQGTGRLTLRGANNYTGATTVSAGTLQIEAANGLGSSAAGTTVNDGATLAINGGAAEFTTFGDALTLSGTGNAGVGALLNQTGNSIVSGLVTLSGNTLISNTGGLLNFTRAPVGLEGGGHDLTLNAQGASISFNSAINNLRSLTANGSRVVALFGSNSIAGPITINGASLQILNNNALSVANAVTVNSGTLQAFRSVTIGSVGGAGNVSIDSAQASGEQPVLTTGGNNSSTVLSGFLSGRGSLIKTGTGTFTLTGGNNLSGLLQIDAGTVQIGNGGTSGTLGSGNVVNNAALVFNRSSNLTVANTISGSGSLTKLGAGTLTLSGANTYSGDTIVDEGTLVLGSVTGGVIDAAGTGRILLTGGNLSSTVTGVLNNLVVIDRSSAVIGATAGNTVTIRGTGFDALGGGGTTLTFGSDNLTGTIVLDANVVTVNTAGALAVGGGTLRLGNSIVGSSLDFFGAGTTIGTGSTAATLDLNGFNASLLNLTGNSAGTITNNGSTGSTVGLVSTVATQFDGRLTDGTSVLSLVKNFGGTLTLTGANSFSGGTTINRGTLQLAGDGTLGTGTVAVAAPGTLAVNRTSDLVISSVISGAGQITKDGAGTLTLSGANTFTGGTTLNAGGLVVTGSLASGVTVNGGTLGGTGTIGGLVTINSGGTLAAGNSPGTMTVGALTLNAGSLTSFELGEAGVAGGANNDLIRVTGTLTLNGGNIDIVQGMGFSNGRYTLFEFGSLAGALGNLTLNPLGGGFVGTLALDGTSVILNAAPPEDLIFWNGTTTSPTGAVVGGNGVWNFTNRNFTEDDGDFSGEWAGNGFNAVFAGTGGKVTIEAGTTVAPSGLAFLVDGYTITGGDAASRLALTGATGVETSAGVGATIAAVISGAGSLTKTGDGTLTLSGVNTYTGNTTVMGGTLVNSGTLVSAVTNMADFTSTGTLLATFINNAGASAELSGNAAQINNFGTLAITGNLTGSAGLSNGTAGLVTVQAGTTANITGLISNNSTAADAFTINGSLSTASQFDNNSGAQLLIGATGSLSTVTGLNNAGSIVNNGTINSIVRNGGTLTATGTISRELINQLGATATVSGNVAQLSNSGTLTLTGTTIGSARLDNFGSGTVTVDAGASASFAGDIFNSGTAANAFTINGSFSSGGLFINQFGANLLVGTTGTLSATNGITNAGGATMVNNGTVASIVNNFGTFTSTGTLQNGLLNGALSATANLSGTVLGTINNSGTINVNGGLLGEAAFVQGGLGVLNFGGFDTGFGSIAGGGTINLGLTTLNVGSNNTSTTFSGVINGPGRLFKTGTGTLTLSGVNNYTGETRITGGTLALASGGQIAGLVRNGTTFTNAGTVLGSVINLGTLTSTGRIDGGLTQFVGAQATVSGTLNGAINTSGAFIVNGNLSSDGFASNTGTGTVLVQSGARWDVGGFDNVSTSANGFVIAGTVINSGFSINRAGATLTINGGGILNSRFFTNEGGRVNNNGLVNADVTNLGNIDNNGTWNGILSHGFGTVTSNTRWNGSFGISAGGLVINNGVWDNGGAISGISSGLFENFGTLRGRFERG